MAARTLDGVAILAGLAALVNGMRQRFVSIDTIRLVTTVESAIGHLQRGELLHWGGSYPLLQAVPAFVMYAAGMTRSEVILGLIELNLAAFAVLLWLACEVRGRSAAGVVLLLIVLLSGTLLWYLHASFGEPLAAAVTGAMVVACWRSRRHFGAAALLFLAGLSKDTAVPFLLLLGLGASVGGPNWADASFRRGRPVALALGAAASLLLAAAYNYARFGTVLDAPYLDPMFFVPWAQTQLSFFAGVWLSPNGGLLPFWPSFGILLLLTAVAAVRAVQGAEGRRARLERAAPAVAVAATLLGMTVELSDWFSPLGWVAWGSRLLLPWAPACAYLLVAAYGGELERLVACLLRPAWRFWASAVLLAAISLPQYVAMGRPSLWEAIFAPDAVCTAPDLTVDAGYYYRCIDHMMWTKASTLLAAYATQPEPLALGLGIACSAGLIWLMYRQRSTLRAAR
jgi:hypothetical protein